VTKTATNGYAWRWSPASGDASSAVVVGSGVRGRLVAEILQSQGWEVAVCDSAGDVALEGGCVALAVLIEKSLVVAVRKAKLLGPAPERPPTVLVCEAIRPGELRIALAAGTLGVVLSGSLGSALVPCVAAACVGQVCVPKSQARQVDAASLSARERQILGLVVMGYMNSEIATQLTVAESTVKSHLSSAFAKLGVKSRHEAVDLILDSERGLGMGILSLGGEPIEGIGSSSG
jgi:DNA-binding NarL/FixJ family response regulator